MFLRFGCPHALTAFRFVFFGQSRFPVLVRSGHSRFQFWDRCQRLHALALDRFGHLRIRKLTDGILLRNDGSP